MAADANINAYADIDDYEVFFGVVAGTVERNRITSLLGKASGKLKEIVDEYGVDEQAKSAALEEVCCNMVNRRVRAASATPLSSVTHQAGGFSETYNYAVSSRVGWQLYPEDFDAIGVAVGGVACVSPWRQR